MTPQPSRATTSRITPTATSRLRNHVLAAVGGRYLDRFERRGDVWAIADRQVVIDWSRAQLAGETWAVQASFATGGRREQDPSAALFQRNASPEQANEEP